MSSSPINDQDFELLSAYLDGQLPAPERSALEERLTAEPPLRAALDGLRETVAILKLAPTLAPPRSFVLDAKSTRLRRIPWYARTRVLEFTGALGAAASILIIVLGAALGGVPNQPSSGASMSYVANSFANVNPTKGVALLPTETGTLASNTLDADKAASAAEVSTKTVAETATELSSTTGGLTGGAAASSTPMLKDQAIANSPVADNPTSAPMPMAASSGGIAAGAAAPQPGAQPGVPPSAPGSSVISASNAAQPPIEPAGTGLQSSDSMSAYATTTEEIAAQMAGQAGAPIDNGSTNGSTVEQGQAATPNAQPEQPRTARIVPTSAATVEQQVLLATTTPVPLAAVSAKVGQSSSGAPQAVLIVGFVLLVLSGMMFALGRLRARL